MCLLYLFYINVFSIVSTNKTKDVSKMRVVMSVTFCLCVLTLVQCTRSTVIDKSTVQNQKSSLSPKFPWDEQTKRKINLIASNIDKLHISNIKSLEVHYKDKKGQFSDKQISDFFRGVMTQNLDGNKDDILDLVDMTKDYDDERKERTAAEVAKHFDADHIERYMNTLVKKERLELPEWAKNTAQSLADEAMENVYKLFNISLVNKS